MLDRFNELQGGSATKTPSTMVRQRPAARAAAAEVEDDNDGEREDEEDGGEEGGDDLDDAGEKKPDPKAAKAAEEKAKKVPDGVQKRINQVTAQRRAAEAKTAEYELRATRAEKAVELVQADNERLRAKLAEAGLLDEKDEQIAELNNRQAAAKLVKETEAAHKKSLEERTQAQTREERQQALEDKLMTAVESQPALVDLLGDAEVARELLVRAARKNLEAHRAGKAKLMSLDDIAAAEAKRLGKVRGDQEPPVDDDSDKSEEDEVEDDVEEEPAPPPAPTRRMPKTIKHRPGGAVRKTHPPTKDGMLARFNELQSQRRE